MSQGFSIRELKAIVEAAGNELFEDDKTPTKTCPDCQGTGDLLTGSDHLFPGSSYECERCNSTGAVFEADEDSDMPGFGYDEEEDDEEDQHYDMKNAEKEKFKGRVIIITDLYDGDVYGYFRNKRFMISSPLWRDFVGPGDVTSDEVEVHSPDFNLSSKEEDFLRLWHLSIINEDDKPYATMKDGPDKYLFRKDQKQKLVGSVDNEPEDGEEELEESPEGEKVSIKENNMINELNELRRMAGFPIVENDDYITVIDNTTNARRTPVEIERPIDNTGRTVSDAKKAFKDVDTGDLTAVRRSIKAYAGMKGKEKIDGEELEETDMDKFIREMQIAAGIIVAENTIKKLNEETGGPFDNKEDAQSNAKSEIGGGKEDSNFKTYKKDDGWYWTEKVEEGKLPDALKQYQFGKKDDDADDKADDDSDDKADDDKEEVDEDVINWMKRFDRLDGSLNEEVVSESEGTKCGVCKKEFVPVGNPDDDMCPSCTKDYLDEDCPTDPEENADGDCSPFTHADENVKMVREEDVDEGIFDEDLLLAPPGDVGPSVDEDDLVYGKEGRGKSYGPKDFDKFSDYPMDEDSNDNWGVGDYVVPNWEGANDYSEPLKVTGVHGDQVRVVDDYGNSELMSANDLRLSPIAEEPNDDERIIDVGDDEDYETHDFDSEFETMLGGSSDPIEGGRAGSMYEMNDLRRLAGLEQIIEEIADEEEVVEEEVVDEADAVEEDRAAGAPITDELIAYEIDDEKAYYVMADILGAELDFGPEDEILVPAARNDQVLAVLDQQGFEKGIDFWVAGEQYEADLQNGYDDRAFSDGQDYFPKGATSQPATDLGPTASNQTDNPMSNKMRMVKKDDVYETMKLSYRRHRKA